MLMSSMFSETPTVSENQRNRFTYAYHKPLVYTKNNYKITLWERKKHNEQKIFKNLANSPDTADGGKSLFVYYIRTSEDLKNNCSMKIIGREV